MNRLVREDNVHFGTVTYQYDHAGNILLKTVHPFTLDDIVTGQGTDFPYEYAQHGWKDQLTSFNGLSCANYDALGNPTEYKGRTLSWQGRRLLSYAKDNISANFTYDANGIRTSKTITQDGAAVTHSEYIFDGNRLVAEQITNNCSISNRYYVYGVDGVAGFSQDGATYLYRKNVQGDVTHIYKQEEDGSLVLVAQYVYDAWGNCKILLDVDGIATANPFRYRSYYLDVETDLYYLQTRYYDPDTGRFISADSIEYLDPETLGGLNLYANCWNNPVMGYDPEGTWDWSRFCTAIVIIAVVAAVLAITVATLGTASGVAGLLGAVIIGATLSAGSDALSQVIFDGKDYTNLDWTRVGISGFAGAVSALIPGSGFISIVGQSLVYNGVYALTNNAIDGREKIGFIEFLSDTVFSFIGAYITKGISKGISKIVDKAVLKGSNYSSWQNYFKQKGFNYDRETVYKKIFAAGQLDNKLNKFFESFIDFIVSSFKKEF